MGFWDFFKDKKNDDSNKIGSPIYKDDSNGMKYQKIVFNSMGGIDSGKREKNKSGVIKKLSEITDFKL